MSVTESRVTYEELLKLTSYGIFSMNFKGISVKDERLNYCEPIKNAAYNGVYTGSPGRDIYYMLPYLDSEQMEEIAEMVVEKFPKTPPGNHVNVGAFVRFIYGQFEKQGILRSDKDFERMKNEELNWIKSREFVKLLWDKLEDIDNFYGLSILCEMSAHRLGDESVINRDQEILDRMEHLYNMSVEYAVKCKSYKQMFTPYYWAFRYFGKFGDETKALFYAYLTIEQAEKYCPDARKGYFSKLSDCMKYIQKYDKKTWSKFYKKYRKNAKNKCVKRAFRKYKV